MDEKNVLLPVKPDGPGQEAVPNLQICVFSVGENVFGVDILDVQEVAPVPIFTGVHHAPPHVAGVVNIRGQVVLCLDLRRILGLSPVPATSESRLILFKPHVGENFGALVDSVGDILEFPPDAIEERRSRQTSSEDSSEEEETTPAIIRGICKGEGDLITVLDASVLLTELDRAFECQEQTAPPGTQATESGLRSEEGQTDERSDGSSH